MTEGLYIVDEIGCKVKKLEILIENLLLWTFKTGGTVTDSSHIESKIALGRKKDEAKK